jgi:glycosyltransferase involved in cell wall biosynthesis
MKSILYVTLIEDPINNGILNSQVVSVLKGVVKAGHRVALFTAPSKKLFFKHLEKEVGEYKQKMDDAGIQFYCSPIPVLTNASLRFYLIPWLILFALPPVLFAAWKQKAEVLHCRSYPASLIGMLVKILTGNIFIFDMRGVYPEEGEFLFSNWQKNGLNFKTWKRIEKHMLISADQILVVSHRFQQHLLSEYPDHADAINKKITTIVCGVSPESIVKGELQQKSIHDPVRLVYSGTLDGWTSPELLAKTYRQILEHNTQHNFVLNIYTTSNQESIHKPLLAEGIDSIKYYIQRLKSDEVAEKLRENDIGILVREKSIVNEVSFPVKLGEYLAAGLPVVTNSALIGAGRFVVENNVGIVLETEKFSLNKLLSDFEGYVQRCHGAVTSLSKNDDQYLSLYRRIS